MAHMIFVCALLAAAVQATPLPGVAEKAKSKVAWQTCSLSERPKGNAVESVTSAHAELADSGAVMGNAIAIMNFAKMEEGKGKVLAAAKDVADASMQIKQATEERLAAEMVLGGQKKSGGVQGVDATSLPKLMEDSKDGSVLVVFYATWCPNCQSFLEAANAPVEDLRRDLEAAHGPKVVKFDSEATTPPVSINNGVPDFYLFDGKTGAKTRYTGSPDLQSLETWALQMSAKKAAASMLQVQKAPTAPWKPYTSWSALDDTFRGIQGKPTKASILSVKRRQLEASEAVGQDEMDSLSPLSKLRVDTSDVSYEMKDGGKAYESWLGKGANDSPKAGLAEKGATVGKHSNADWHQYAWKFAGGLGR